MGEKGTVREVIFKVQVDRNNIGFINAIFEGYEHVAIVRVVDKKNSIMEIYTSSDFKKTTREIIQSLKEEYGILIKVLEVREEAV